MLHCAHAALLLLGDMAAARAVAERGVAAQGPLGGLMGDTDASNSLI